MPTSRRAFACLILATLASAVLVSAPVALALFADSEKGGPETVSSGAILAPTNATAAQVNCRVNKSPEANLTWTASSSSYVTSYSVERSTSSNGSYTVLGSVSASKTSYTDGESLAYSTTYYYRVSAVYRSWEATSSVSTLKTLNKTCQSQGS
jgi:hypothetical protein